MSAALWQDILSTLDGITTLVQASLPPAGAQAGPDALTSLSTEITARMNALGATLATGVAADDAQAMKETLVLYLDEQVMAQLSLPDLLDWPLLQEPALPSEDGGDVFYDRLDKLLLRPPAAPSMLLEVYAWCLDAGFHGRYGDARVKDYRDALAKVLAPDPKTPIPNVPKPSSLPKSGPPAALYYAATALIVAAICVVPMLLSWL